MSSSFEMILFGVYILVRRAVAGVVSKDELPILMKETIVSLKTIALYYLRPRQTQLETCFVLTFCTEHRLATLERFQSETRDVSARLSPDLYGNNMQTKQSPQTDKSNKPKQSKLYKCDKQLPMTSPARSSPVTPKLQHLDWQDATVWKSETTGHADKLLWTYATPVAVFNEWWKYPTLFRGRVSKSDSDIRCKWHGVNPVQSDTTDLPVIIHLRNQTMNLDLRGSCCKHVHQDKTGLEANLLLESDIYKVCMAPVVSSPTLLHTKSF